MATRRSLPDAAPPLAEQWAAVAAALEAWAAGLAAMLAPVAAALARPPGPREALGDPTGDGPLALDSPGPP